MKKNLTYCWYALRIAGVSTLLLVYLMGYFNTQLLHQLQHSHEHEAFHTQEVELDSCHRAVFHHEKNACEHKTHITSPEQDCELCDIIVQQDQFEILFLDEIQEPLIERTNFALPNFMVLTFTPFNPSRAPPLRV